MRYDLYLFAAEPCVEPMQTLERLDEEHEAARDLDHHMRQIVAGRQLAAI